MGHGMEQQGKRSGIISDEEVDAIISEFQGDPREAIRALLHDIDVLASDALRAVSKGYVRGFFPRMKERLRSH
jgi:hypothetical protein